LGAGILIDQANHTVIQGTFNETLAFDGVFQEIKYDKA